MITLLATYQWLCRVFALTAILMGIWCVSQLTVASTARSSQFVIDWPAYDPNGMLIGSHDLAIQVANLTNHPGRILGMSKVCGRNSCVTPKQEQPVPVGPGETVSYRFQLDVHSSGPFEVQVVLFLEEDCVRKATTALCGVGTTQ
jgi:hypothetical protein